MFNLRAASDFSRPAVLSHQLKGTGEGYGFAEISRLGAALEQFAREKGSVGKGARTDLLLKEVPELVAQRMGPPRASLCPRA